MTLKRQRHPQINADFHVVIIDPKNLSSGHRVHRECQGLFAFPSLTQKVNELNETMVRLIGENLCNLM